jgi:outer membrane lipoprotein-sorting protein
MKLIQIFRILSFSLLTLSFTTQAQTSNTNDPRAEAILEGVTSKYKPIAAFRATFTYTLESSGSGAKESFPGELVVKGQKYRMKMGEQEVINNGTTIWTYLRDADEVNISNYEPEEDEINPSRIFNVYKKGYKYLFNEEIREKGITYEVVDLVPENRNSQIFKIRLTISKKDKTLKNMRVFEKNGTRSLYSITKFTADDTVEDKLFAFDVSKHKGVEVIDLR